jgi:hypothetical protein
MGIKQFNEGNRHMNYKSFFSTIALLLLAIQLTGCGGQ